MTVATAEHACGTHTIYKLSCEDYDAIRSTFNGMCWRCLTARGGQIDHAHAEGMAAVRGYLCAPCNVRMIEVDAGVERTAYDQHYLDRAWHVERAVPFVPDNRTSIRTFRVDNNLWAQAKELAAWRRETVTALLKRALEEYVELHGGEVRPKRKEGDE